MRRFASVLMLALAVSCGGETPSSPELPRLDTFTLDGTWELTHIEDDALPVPTGDTIICDDGAGGRDTATERWEFGDIVFEPDEAEATTVLRHECGGITTILETSSRGAYTAREDSLFFNWDPPFPSIRRASWTVGDSIFETVGEFRFAERP